jgi:esterase/lipase superfamily enzyme
LFRIIIVLSGMKMLSFTMNNAMFRAHVHLFRKIIVLSGIKVLSFTIDDATFRINDHLFPTWSRMGQDEKACIQDGKDIVQRGKAYI